MGAFTYELRFPGQFFDQGTKLHYNYLRDYDPRTGRHIESNPIGLAGGINTYVYVGGNPVSRKDSQGTDYGISTPSPTLPASHPPPSGQQMCFAGTLIDKRYDEVGGMTHCTYSTPFGTYTLEFFLSSYVAGAILIVIRQISVSSISISKTASERILKERDSHSQLLGRSVIPCLLYYHRSYSTLNDGRIIEHGPGLTLSFIELSEASQYRHLTVDLGNDCTLLVGPSTFFQAGAHSIDWVDQKFKLNSVVC